MDTQLKKSLKRIEDAIKSLHHETIQLRLQNEPPLKPPVYHSLGKGYMVMEEGSAWVLYHEGKRLPNILLTSFDVGDQPGFSALIV